MTDEALCLIDDFVNASEDACKSRCITGECLQKQLKWYSEIVKSATDIRLATRRNPTKNIHVIPGVYLRNWAYGVNNKGAGWLNSIDSIFESHISTSELTWNESHSDVMEVVFSLIERGYADLVPQHLQIEDLRNCRKRAVLSTFFALLRMRNQELRRIIDITDSARFEETIYKELFPMAGVMAHAKWHFERIEESIPFSRIPVISLRPSKHARLSGPKIGTHFIFPVTQSSILLIHLGKSNSYGAYRPSRSMLDFYRLSTAHSLLNEGQTLYFTPESKSIESILDLLNLEGGVRLGVQLKQTKRIRHRLPIFSESTFTRFESLAKLILDDRNF